MAEEGSIPDTYGFATAFNSAALWLGDWLFLVGSLIDVAIQYVDLPIDPNSHRDLWIAIGGLASAILWFVDSIIYLIADLHDAGAENPEVEE